MHSIIAILSLVIAAIIGSSVASTGDTDSNGNYKVWCNLYIRTVPGYQEIECASNPRGASRGFELATTTYRCGIQECNKASGKTCQIQGNPYSSTDMQVTCDSAYEATRTKVPHYNRVTPANPQLWTNGINCKDKEGTMFICQANHEFSTCHHCFKL
ncbi:hypothetical protein CROQUDRAFT_669096 [Cronartium quercuum f. sp. fusiforme G11]|uniref:Secreted protein n=1 Tax=Cronartium quercuum f. sp. fusiforme G11 TaxID=708437 RepID=A0A9P6NP94_9BASI|nr:hypothetical protein CROQUDRAFT_669096 [Cronartium quercuum f. sp. fusiforme G11]